MGAPIDIRTGHLVDTGLDESAEWVAGTYLPDNTEYWPEKASI
jgi:hypothetical protein